jgi:urease accessory protein
MKIYNKRINPSDLTQNQIEKLKHQKEKGNYLQIDFDTRQRSRFRATLQNGKRSVSTCHAQVRSKMVM